MNKNIKCILFLLLASTSYLQSKAQLSILKMDSLAKIVCTLQSQTEDSVYNIGTIKYKLSFPEESFGFNFQNGMAWKSVYKTNKGDTYLFITENIDLSQVTGFTWDRSYTSRILVHFPKGYIKTNVSKNGAEPYIIDEEYLEFFCTDDIAMLLPLASFCHRLKFLKGKIKESDIIKFEQNFLTVLKLDFELVENGIENFLYNNDNSLFKPIIVNYRKIIYDTKKYWAEAEKAKSFCDSLCVAFKYKPQLYSAMELEKFNPETKKLLKNKNYIPTRDGYGQWSAGLSTLGPAHAVFKSDGLIYYYSFGEYPNGINAYENRKNWLRNNIAERLLEELYPANGSHIIHITHNEKDPCIVFNISTSFEIIQFSPTKYNKDFHR